MCGGVLAPALWTAVVIGMTACSLTPVRKKKSFKELSPPQQALALVTIAISLVLIGAAQRDLQSRPADEIRGDKRLWRVVCLNGFGALGYLVWGRRS
jgi:hypothetical protein